jgi:protein tyrosine phosphatase (PTP) superfamily phosphohydrolase (DUF442 family)
MTEETIPENLIDIPYINNPLPGILTAGQPEKGHFEELKEAGYHTIIDLRAEGEPGTWDEKALADEMGLFYRRIPIRGPQNLTPQTVNELDELLENSSDGVFIHCASSNRVGALLALRASWNQGESEDEALQLGRAAGLTSLEDTTRKLLANPL